MTFAEVLPFLMQGKIARRIKREWVLNYERIRLEGYDLALYDKYGYVTNFLLWKDDLESDDWEVLEDDCNGRERVETVSILRREGRDR